MKTNFAIVLILAALYSVISGTAEVDWKEAFTIVQQIQKAYVDTVRDVRLTAWHEDKVIGAKVESKTFPVGENVSILLIRMENQVKSKSLTEADAREIFEKLVDLHNGFLEEITDDISKLPVSTQNQIDTVTDSNFQNLQRLFLTLYDVLGDRIH